MATINGTAGNDTLSGFNSNDTINGLGGNDLFLAAGPNGGGADFIDGGTGTDSIEFRERATSAIVLDFAAGTITGGGSGTITFANIERVVASNFNDSLSGNAAGQTLTGQSGADALWGAGGVDTLWGGSGGDTFIFREVGSAHADRISDWASGSDTLVLDGSVMSQLGANGDFVAGDARFWSSSSGLAHDADDRIIFNTTTRQVFYDADGNGAGTAQLIATLSNATLVATDIAVENGSTGGGGGFVGSEGSETITGTSGDDTIDGLGGNDVLIGNEGADSMRGGNGNDTLFAGEGAGSDLTEDFAVDTLDGGLGDDVYHVHGDDGDVLLADPGGLDTVIAWNSDWTLGPGFENLDLADDRGVASAGTGNELDNRISGATEGGTLLGLGGNDTLILRIAQNSGTARGGEGNDTIFGSSSFDALFGDNGNDLLITGGGAGSLTGGAGADIFFFNSLRDSEFDPHREVTDFASASDTIRLDAIVMPALGASGRFAAGDARFAANSTGSAQDPSDRVIYNLATGELWYDASGSATDGDAKLIAVLDGAPTLAATDIEVVNGTAAPSGQVINGTAGNDTLSGTSGNDTISGLGGNDLFLAGANGGNDTIDGGTGTDSIEFRERATSGVVVDFGPGSITGGGSGTISFTSVERVVASNFNDSLTGTAGTQTLTGQSGADTIWGASGADTLWGGGGNDAFVFREMGTSNADRVSDFASGLDKVHLDDSAFTAIGAGGNFVSGDSRFWASSNGAAHDSNDRVTYNTTTGQLYYDADGNGTVSAPQLIGTFAGTAVTATDIAVI